MNTFEETSADYDTKNSNEVEVEIEIEIEVDNDDDDEDNTDLYKVGVKQSIFGSMAVAQIEDKMKQCIDEAIEYFKPNVVVSWNAFFKKRFNFELYKSNLSHLLAGHSCFALLLELG